MMNSNNLKQWENEMNVCIRCGYCFEGCPVFKEGLWETDGPRGKMVLAHALLTGALEPSRYVAEKIYQCTYCKDCIERCSSKVSIPDVMTAARADLLNAGFSYDSHLALLDKIKRSGNIFGRGIESPVREGETLVLLGCRFLERTEAAKRYLAILEKLGLKPRVVNEICCGMPFAVLGYKDELAAHKEEFRKRFPFQEFICLCTTCAFFIKKAYPDLKPKYVIQEIAERLPGYTTRNLGLKATSHDPCNRSRGMDMTEEPRAILRQIGVDLVELPTTGKQAECCGGGGGVLVTDRALSEKLAEKRLEQALDLEVEALATLCPTCELNLGNAADRQGGTIKVQNLLDLVYEAVV